MLATNHVAALPRPALKPLPPVRIAVEADAPQLLELGRMLHEENGLSGWAEDAVQNTMWRGIRGDRSVFGVIGPVGHVEAMILLFVGRMWYSNDPHIEELLSYVHPDHRKSENAKALVEFAKAMSDRVGVPLLIGIVSNDRTEQKIRLYQRRLGKPSGAYFIYGAKTGRNGR